MADEKEIITRITFLNHNDDHEVIFDTYNSYDLSRNIEFPESRTLHVGNKITIDETTYSIEEITVEVLNPESRVRQNSLQVIIFLDKVEFQ